MNSKKKTSSSLHCGPRKAVDVPSRTRDTISSEAGLSEMHPPGPTMTRRMHSSKPLQGSENRQR
eukprot:scaffold488859_cov22-Prasinocladus_malaysianus.AAC.1